MRQVPSRVNQLCDLFRTEHRRQLPGVLGKRYLIEQVWTPKGLDEEEPQIGSGCCQATTSDRETGDPGTRGYGLGPGALKRQYDGLWCSVTPLQSWPNRIL